MWDRWARRGVWRNASGLADSVLRSGKDVNRLPGTRTRRTKPREKPMSDMYGPS